MMLRRNPPLLVSAFIQGSFFKHESMKQSLIEIMDLVKRALDASLLGTVLIKKTNVKHVLILSACVRLKGTA